MNTTGFGYNITSRWAAEGLAPLPGKFEFEKNDSDFSYTFKKETSDNWGDVGEVSAQRFVKYTNGYKNRVVIDFEKQSVEVTTLSPVAKERHLENSIVAILLAPDSPDKVDVFSSKDIESGGEPFLLNRLVDNEGQKIRWSWRARKYAKHLIKTSSYKSETSYHKGLSVKFYFNGTTDSSINVITNGLYAAEINKAALKYSVQPGLIKAIIQTESSFNPFAVSGVGAYGLMQVMPKTAGADVFKHVYKKNGIPTKKHLFDPEKNIDMGTAYIHVLQNRYLKSITNETSKKYLAISSYNGGVGTALSLFEGGSRKEKFAFINKMDSETIKKRLIENHPFEETRNYLSKVLKAESSSSS
ncbi:murein transglycosylase domain-containing protein [Vibrio barjaei]|uniref:murein transglycosylase domain-containing protein n=1 Tax=Vibrio barjaei TaxID=1676683 RepID=UPI0022849054|nr:murein transglycosylase domain-containing protein [Vibrio barjaei]MCY9872337.1 murein transglycosylase domain-containing protein [Vibrio barjaei]